MAVSIGMQQDRLPIGFAVHHQDRYTDSWSYNIIAERLIAYNHGTINEIQVESIERNLERIIDEFTEMKKDLSFLLRAKQEYAYEPKFRKYDYIPNGKLRIVTFGDNFIRDTSTSGIEDRIGEVLLALYLQSESVRIEREKREEAKRKAEEE